MPAGTNGIQVQASHVTIDLNGFRLSGGGAAKFGIRGGAKGVTIRNGTISGFSNDGVFIPGAFAIIKDMRIVENQGTGIVCGDSCLIEASVISRNGAIGASIDSGTVVGNAFVENAGNAIQAGTGVGAGHNALILNNGGNDTQENAFGMDPNLCRSDGGFVNC